MQTRRENNSILAKMEYASIQRLLPHIPQAVTPDHLTYLGLAGACLAALAFVGCLVSAAFLPLAILGLFLNWVGDSFDGNLARYRSKERPRYGFMIDHSVDLLSTTLILIGLGASPYLPFNSACFVLIIYLLFCGYVYVKISADGIHTLAFGGLGATEFRLLVAAWVLLVHVFHLQDTVNAAFVEGQVLGGTAIADLLVGSACCMAFFSLVAMIFQQATKLRDIENRDLQIDDVKLVKLSSRKISTTSGGGISSYEATPQVSRSIARN